MLLAFIKRHDTIHPNDPIKQIIFDKESSLIAALDTVHQNHPKILTRNTGGKIHCPKAEAQIGEMKRRQRAVLSDLSYIPPSFTKLLAFIYVCEANNILHRSL